MADITVLKCVMPVVKIYIYEAFWHVSASRQSQLVSGNADGGAT
jgi:hypothetical protein